MQPDQTPDLDELERMHSGLVHKRHRVAIFTPDANDSELVAQINGIVNALPWLLRAARERDELRAELDRINERVFRAFGYLPIIPGSALTVVDHNIDVHVSALADEWAVRERQLAAERARAEKAEARAKELEGMLTKAEPRLAVALRQSRNRNELDALYATNDLADIRDALAQKEPR